MAENYIISVSIKVLICPDPHQSSIAVENSAPIVVALAKVREWVAVPPGDDHPTPCIQSGNVTIYSIHNLLFEHHQTFI
jgi:hypothetical protein